MSTLLVAEMVIYLCSVFNGQYFHDAIIMQCMIMKATDPTQNDKRFIGWRPVYIVRVCCEPSKNSYSGFQCGRNYSGEFYTFIFVSSIVMCGK